MNSGRNNTFTPTLSGPELECLGKILMINETCPAEEMEGLKSLPPVPKKIQNCFEKNKCTPKQKQEGLKLFCPAWKKVSTSCMKPAIDCILEVVPNDAREQFTGLVSECETLSAKSGSTNTTTSGNGTPTNTPTSGNGNKDTPVTSAGFSVQGSLISILSFALLL
jgi:hypothetical protein